MSRGAYISAALHGALLLWLMLGGIFTSEPPEFDVADVTVLSEAEFAALTQSDQPAQTEPPVAPTPPTPQPEPEPPAPAPAPVPEPAPEPPTPAPAPEPVPVPPPPLPEPEPPAPTPEALPAPPPSFAAPEISTRPKPRPAPRVAPTPVAPPPPDAVVDPEVQQAADPDADSPDRAEDAQEQTAPEEAATEIVTEAETPASAAPTRSLRPQTRSRAVQQAAARPTPSPEPEPAPSTQDAVDDALSALLADELGGTSPSAPTGPPLTRGEREGLRLAVQECWVVDVGSEAANVVVTVAMDMGRDGRVVASSIRMVGATGGSGPAVEVAYQAARRAVLRCQRDGYGLPADKYEQWKQIEMTFNPAEMRLR